MYARNVYNFASLLLKDGALVFDWEDELLSKTVWPSRGEPSDTMDPNASARAG